MDLPDSDRTAMQATNRPQQAQKARNIPYIPPELISRIFDHVDESDKTTFCAIVLCSKTFYDLAAPYLFKTIHLSHRPDLRLVHRTLASLAVLCTEKPEIARHVQHFSLRNGSFSGYLISGHVETWYSLSKAAVRIGSQLGRPRFCKEQEDLQRTVSGQTQIDAMLVLLLPQLNALKTLDLEISYGMPSHIEKMLQSAVATRTPIMTSLTSVTLIYSKGGAENRYWGPLLVEWMSLPSVNTICLRKNGHSEISWEIWNAMWASYPARVPMDPVQPINALPAASLKIKSLELRDCAFTPQAFSSLLNAFQGLECFIYEADQLRSHNHGIPLDFLHRCMLRHKYSLEKLWLGYTPKPCYNLDNGYQYLGPQQSFGMFTKLKHLRVPIALIMNVTPGSPSELHKRTGNCFPHSIEIIHLSNCNVRRSEHLALRLIRCILLDKRNGYLPAVKEIKITIPSSDIARATARRVGGAEYILLFATELDNAVIIETYSGEEEERKWGMCEDISRPPCSDGLFRRNTSRFYNLEEMVRIQEERNDDSSNDDSEHHSAFRHGDNGDSSDSE